VLGGIETVLLILFGVSTCTQTTWVIETYQGNDDFAVRVGLEVVLVVKVLADGSVVVDLTVDSEGEGAVIVDKGLGTGV
jgi:hypothetical protein